MSYMLKQIGPFGRNLLVGEAGFEPATSRLWASRAARLLYSPIVVSTLQLTHYTGRSQFVKQPFEKKSDRQFPGILISKYKSEATTPNR